MYCRTVSHVSETHCSFTHARSGLCFIGSHLGLHLWTILMIEEQMRLYCNIPDESFV